MPGFRIIEAITGADLAAVAALFDAYAASLPIDLGYQDFATERATLPGKYAPPGGALLLARDDAGEARGCVALRALDGGALRAPAGGVLGAVGDGGAEIKRLYVAHGARGLGLGSALLDAVTRAAIGLGHRALCLDTLPFMTEAQALYLRAGFRPIPPYYDCPVAGTVFLGRDLP